MFSLCQYKHSREMVQHKLPVSGNKNTTVHCLSILWTLLKKKTVRNRCKWKWENNSWDEFARWGRGAGAVPLGKLFALSCGAMRVYRGHWQGGGGVMCSCDEDEMEEDTTEGGAGRYSATATPSRTPVLLRQRMTLYVRPCVCLCVFPTLQRTTKWIPWVFLSVCECVCVCVCLCV